MRASKAHSSQILAIILSLILATGLLTMPVLGEQSSNNIEEPVLAEADGVSEDEVTDVDVPEDSQNVSETEKGSKEEYTEYENGIKAETESSESTENQEQKLSSGDTGKQTTKEDNANEGVSDDNTLKDNPLVQSDEESDSNSVVEEESVEPNEKHDYSDHSSEDISAEPEQDSVSTEAQNNGPKTIEVIGGQYYFYIYATTYRNLSFSANSDTFCSVVQGNTFSNAGNYYYQLNLYPKDGGHNTIIQVYDNDSGQNIDILIVHSSYQEAEAQTICTGKNIEVSFETINEINKDDILVGSTGSESSISCLFNSLTSEGIVSHGSNIPYTYRYTANFTLHTLGQYTVILMDNSTYTTLESIPVTVVEHDYDSGVITSDATCQKKAVLTKTCSICGDKINEEIGDYADHTWNDNYTIDKDATCKEEGSESIHCSICDVIDEGTVRGISKKEHTYGDWKVTKDACCTENGSKEKYCAVCGDKVTEEIPATGHTWNEEYTVDKEATCTEEGAESIHCSVCGEIDEDTVRATPKTAHNYGDWTVTKEATCIEEGSKERVCGDCGNKETETIPAAGHTWNEDYTVDKEATCTEEGSESIHCSVCREIDEDTIRAIPKKQHAYGDWTVTKEATCTEVGSKDKVCAECNDKVTETIPATGHTWNEEYSVDKEATCTEEGSESIHCSVCGEIDEDTVRATPKTAHNYGDWTVTKEATCTEDGSKEKGCTDCNEKVTDTIPAAGHVWDEDYTVDKEATCTEEGSESIHCSVCGEIDKETVRAIPKKEHAYGDWTVTKEASCTEEGSKEKVCTDCGDKITEVVPATGHTWNEGYTVDKEATQTEEGSESIHCAVCNIIKEGSERTIATLSKTVDKLNISALVNKTYNGNNQTQSIVIKDGTVILKEGADYILSYGNNKNAGTATVTITGKGNYTGTVNKTFTIAKAAQSFSVSGAPSVECGKTTKINAAGAKETSTYYFVSSNTGIAAAAGDGTVTGINPGTASITISTPATANYNAATWTVTINVIKNLKKPGYCHFVKWNNKNYTGCRIAWNRAVGAEGYQTQLCWTNGSHESITNVGPNVLYRDCKVYANHVSLMRVRAFYTFNGQRIYGPWSNMEFITPSPTKLTCKNVSVGNDLKMKVSWPIIYGSNGYNVFITTNPNGKWSWNQSTAVKANALSAVITKYQGGKLKKNTRYYVRIVTRRKFKGVFCSVPMPAKNTYVGSFIIK